MGQVVAVISGKGGTGKTCLTAAVASCLAAEGQSVLCIDCDAGLRNLDIPLGLSDEAAIPFTAVMDGDCDLDAAAVHPKIPGLHLLTAPVTRTAEELDQEAFRLMIARAREQFDWCFLDAPAGVGTGFRLTAHSADRALIVSGSDPATLRDAARSADLAVLEGVRQMDLVVNRVSPRLYRRTGATVDDVMDGVGLPLLGVVPEDINVTLAAARQIPLVLFSNRGASVACLHIARRLRGIKAPLLRIR